jgi:hypothetical protein
MANEARNTYQYKNTKAELLNCNANIYFNQQCVKKDIIPKYAKIKIPNTLPVVKLTKTKSPGTMIKDKIKCLYIKAMYLCNLM